MTKKQLQKYVKWCKDHGTLKSEISFVMGELKIDLARVKTSKLYLSLLQKELKKK